MENNWEPRVGQKVVCIDLTNSKYVVTHKPVNALKLNHEYTVLGVKKSCCNWVVDIGIKNPGAGSRLCTDCGKPNPYEKKWWFASFRFAPISEQYADMTAEIAQQFIEHPDKADQPIKILETVN